MEGPTLRVVVSKLDMDTEDTTTTDKDDQLPSISSISNQKIFNWDINYGYDDDDNDNKQDQVTLNNHSSDFEDSNSEEGKK